jgi:hypothetical protein
MPSRKAEQIVQVLRSEILSGQRAPGAKLPTYDAFIEQFGVTRPTIARGLKALRSEGLVTVDGTRGVFVAKTFPHHNRYLWVTGEQPGSADWTSLSDAILELIQRKNTGIPGEVVPLVGVDGRTNNPAYQLLCDAVEHGSAAGLLLMNSRTPLRLPVLDTPGVARVAISAPLPHAAFLGLDVDGLIERAASRLSKKGRRIAVFSPHADHLERAQESLLARGVDKKRLMTLHVGVVGCEKITELLCERPDRPDAIFVTDDSLLPPLLAGLARADMRPGRDVYVLSQGYWPRRLGPADGVERIGFDVRELLDAARTSIEAQRVGQPSPPARVLARFASELALGARAPGVTPACLAVADHPAERIGAKPSPRLSSAA